VPGSEVAKTARSISWQDVVRSD